MTWEVLEKKRFGSGVDYGPDWESRPCVAITKTGVSFNKCFCETFSVAPGSGLCIHIDKKNRRLGFKSPAGEHEEQNAFRVQGDRKGKKSTLFIGVPRVARLFADALGKAFVAKMNVGQHVIEVDLNQKTEAPAGHA